jgi:probable 2-oxoglutarate dehydrogenase E1 component DHKTD1
LRYVDSVRTHGHRAALIDPLDILQRDQVAALNPRRYGLVDDTKKFNVEGIFWADPIDPSASAEDWWTLGEITRHLHSIYVGRIAYEYMHSTSKMERLWFQRHLERPMLDIQILSEEEKEGKKRIHELLAYSETFDSFLQLKFPNLKRYGLEGGESMLPALDTLFSVSSQGSRPTCHAC